MDVNVRSYVIYFYLIKDMENLTDEQLSERSDDIEAVRERLRRSEVAVLAERKAKEEAVRAVLAERKAKEEAVQIRDSLRRYNAFLREREAIKRMNIRGGCAFTSLQFHHTGHTS